jgi:hypothetical protein
VGAGGAPISPGVAPSRASRACSATALAGRWSIAEAVKAQAAPPVQPAITSVGQWTPSHTRLSAISSERTIALAIRVTRTLCRGLSAAKASAIPM